mgnify:FL=1|jgi:hypothetical protein
MYMIVSPWSVTLTYPNSIMVLLKSNGFVDNPFKTRDDVARGLTGSMSVFLPSME